MNGTKKVIYNCELTQRELALMIDAIDEWNPDGCSSETKDEIIRLRKDLNDIWVNK